MAAVPEYFGSPDASSFPSGGLRATFEARGYPEHYVAYSVTAWPDYADGGQYITQIDITDESKHCIYTLDRDDTDAAIVEIGGTVGDIESQPFLEAIRQVAAERGRNNVMFLHISLIVSIPGTGELKSKPTQHSAKELLSLGIQPDVIVCRSDVLVPGGFGDRGIKGKISAAGLTLTGLSPDGTLVEMVELAGHPWFVGGRFHPELRSRPNRAHPLFREFVAAAAEHRS